MRTPLRAVIASLCFVTLTHAAESWPQFRGPNAQRRFRIGQTADRVRAGHESTVEGFRAAGHVVAVRVGRQDFSDGVCRR